MAQNVELVEGDVGDPASLERACRGAECVYHAAARVGDWGPWPDFVRIKGLLKQPVIFDGRNIYDPGDVRKLGFTYYSIGRNDG